MNDIAVSARNLAKAYAIAHATPRHTTLGEALVHTLRHGLQRSEKETFWALDDFSFDITRGEVVGIIGRNGAGKSTLLKILSQITAPTRGEVDLRGRVGSLLEVGAGFHPELTGRENIFLNGAILGMRRAEITRKFDEIVAFSEVEKFLDTPVKRYSSGMYVRLAFSVAAYLEPEILIVDEVLAVGDTSFQKKCLGKMSDISARDGRTVIFVSHHMAAVQQLCTGCLLLEKGRIAARGTPAEITSLYLDRAGAPALAVEQSDADFVMSVHAFDLAGEPTRVWPYGDRLCLEATILARKPLWKPAVDLTFYDDQRRRLFSIQSDRLDASPVQCEGRWSFHCEVENPGFTLGEITVDAGLREGSGEYIVLQLDAARLATDLSSLPEGADANALLHPRLTHRWEEKP